MDATLHRVLKRPQGFESGEVGKGAEMGRALAMFGPVPAAQNMLYEVRAEVSHDYVVTSTSN